MWGVCLATSAGLLRIGAAIYSILRPAPQSFVPSLARIFNVVSPSPFLLTSLLSDRSMFYSLSSLIFLLLYFDRFLFYRVASSSSVCDALSFPALGKGTPLVFFS